MLAWWPSVCALGAVELEGIFVDGLSTLIPLSSSRSEET